MAIIGAHQMRLRSSAHPSHVLDGFHRHGGILAFGNQRSAPPSRRLRKTKSTSDLAS
jgi:hypothetical protein